MQALNSSGEDFLRILPGKTIYSTAADKLGITVERYFSLISTALNIPDAPNGQPKLSAGLLELKKDILSALENILPSRKYENTPN